MYKTNLLPRDLQPQPAINKQRLMRMLTVALLGCFIAGSYIFLVIDIHLKQQMLTSLRQEASTGELATKKLVQIQKERQQNEEVINKLQQIISNNINWHDLLNDVNQCLPTDTWFTAISLSTIEAKDDELPNQLLVFNGNSTNLSSIGVFIYNLQQLTYFSGVYLDYAKELDSPATPPLLTFKISVTFSGGDNIE
ncbi:PilN domain-containing protein [Peptococcaceae bacterium 1198_IL3148]